MNLTGHSFYASQSLQDTFRSGLAAAESSGAITALEGAWLKQVLEDDTGLWANSLFVSRHQSRPALLAGAYMLRDNACPDEYVFLLTVLGGLERYVNVDALRHGLEQALDDPVKRVEWLHVVPVDVRPALAQPGQIQLLTQPLSLSIKAHASQSMAGLVQQSQEDTLASLVAVPSLRSLLDAQLKVQMERAFAGQSLDAHSIRVHSTRRGAHSSVPSETVTSLSSVALDFFVKGQLAADESHRFSGPFIQHVQDDDDTLLTRFTGVLRAATEQLPMQMNEALADYWREAQAPKPTAHAYCVARLRDIFFQHAVQAHHAGEISAEQFLDLKQLASGASGPRKIQAIRLRVFQVDGAEVLLCALLGIFVPGQTSEVFLFSASTGLTKLSSRARLKAYVLNPLRDPSAYESIAHHAPLDQQALLAGMSAPRLSVENIEGDVFDQCMLDIRLKQARDFGYLLHQYQVQTQVLAALDHALDIRGLIDPAFLRRNTQGRWDSRFVPNTNGLRLSCNDNGGLADLLSLKLPIVQAQRDALLRHWPTPRSAARQQLLEPLMRAGHAGLDITHTVVQIFDRPPQAPGAVVHRASSLVDAFLEHFTGRHAFPLDPAHIQVGVTSKVSDEVKPLKKFGGTKLLTVLDQAVKNFAPHYQQQLTAFFFARRNPLADDSLASRLAMLRMVMLRAEVRLNYLDNSLSLTDQAIVKTVLGYPVSTARPALKHFVPDVYRFSLALGGMLNAVAVANCFLVTERGGLESIHAGRAIIWTPLLGFEGFESLDVCRAGLEARWLDKTLRGGLLNHVSCAEQPLVEAYLDRQQDGHPAEREPWLYFDRIESDFVRDSQNLAIGKMLKDADYLCLRAHEAKMSAQAFENMALSQLVEGRAGVTFGYAQALADAQVFKASLPDWLKNASADEQLQYANLLQRYQYVVQGKGYYLRDIPDINDYSRTHLKARLLVDFPSLVLDPDAIEVVVDTYDAAPVLVGSTPSFLPAATSREVQTLTQFALNGFYRLVGGAIFLRSSNGAALPVALDAGYLKRMVRKLDIGGAYQQVLKTRLAPGHEGVALRQHQFAEQLVLQTLEQGLQGKLSGRLSETAYRYLEHVLSRPDGTAREALTDVAVIIKPLELIADTGREPDPATGIYMIGPLGAQTGPCLLWVMYSQRFSLTEYASETAVLADIHSSAALQTLLLQRLPASEHKTYANGGFVEPHLPRYIDSTVLGDLSTPAPVTLASRPIAGNLFLQLYSDNYHLLLAMAALQSKTTAEKDWESFKYLLTLVVSTAIMFVPGKLSIPFVVWQGVGLAREGVASFKKGDWVLSVEQFALALVMLASSRRTLHPGLENSTVTLKPAQRRLPSETQTTREKQQAALTPFQANDIALRDLNKDLDSQIYSDPRSGLKYVHWRGQVFRIYPWRQRWRIYMGEHREGPLIKLNTQQVWEVDADEFLFGGAVLSRLDGYTNLAVNALSYEIRAIGMESIERRYPHKALAIREAHSMAIGYLQRSRRALQTLHGPDAEAVQNRQWISRFFDVGSVDQALEDQLSRAFDDMLARFMHPEMSPHTSNKYVVCRSRFGSHSSAFVNRLDGAKRVYLTEEFFSPVFEQPYLLSHPYLKQTVPPFPVSRQLQASFLLHEITHQVLGTEDIHYLNAGFPYLDLFDTSEPLGRELKDMTETFQQCHTPQLPLEHIFQKLDPDTMGWSDIPSGPAKAKVKSIAGVNTLEEARQVFKHDPAKRVDLMLANADTVVLLLLRLGRNYPVSA